MRLRTLFSAVCSTVFLAGCLSSGVKESPLGPCEERLPTAEVFEIEVSRGSIAFVDVFEDANASANGCGTLQLVADSWQDGEKGIVHRSEERPNELAYLADREAIGDDVFSYRVTNGFNELEVNVSVRVYQRLTLEGSFPHGWIDAPRVLLDGNAASGEGEVTGNGAFELELRLFDLGSNFANSLSIEGERNGNAITLHSVLPGNQSLYGLKTGDNQISDRQVSNLRVNALTTAYAMLLNNAAPDLFQLTENEMNRYGRAIDRARFLNTATWVYLLATNSDYHLPEGVSSTRELGAERELLESLIDEADSAGDLAAAASRMLNDADFLPLVNDSDLSGRFAELDSQVPWWPVSSLRSWAFEQGTLRLTQSDQTTEDFLYSLSGATIRINGSAAPFSELKVLVNDPTQLVVWTGDETIRLEREVYLNRSNLEFNLSHDWVLPALPRVGEELQNTELLYTFDNGTFSVSHANVLGAEVITSGQYSLNADGTELQLIATDGETFVLRREGSSGMQAVTVLNETSESLRVGTGFALEDVEALPKAVGGDLYSARDERTITNWAQGALLQTRDYYFFLNSNGSEGSRREPGTIKNFKLELVTQDDTEQVVELAVGQPVEAYVYWKILRGNSETQLQVLEWHYELDETNAKVLTHGPQVNLYCKDLTTCSARWW